MHCWHTEKLFSKFAFGAGKYDKMDLTERYGNINGCDAMKVYNFLYSIRGEMSTVVDYITVIAVSSHRLSDGDFGRYVRYNANVN